MRRTEYLRHLRDSVRVSGSSGSTSGDRTSTPLFRRTPVTESALAAIMRDIGLTEEQVVQRFGYVPEDVAPRDGSPRTPEFG